MTKQKLSRDQKRKQKKRKEQQRKQKPAASGSQPVIAFNPDNEEFDRVDSAVDVDYEAQEARLRQILNVEEELPEVNKNTLQPYFDYLKTHLQLPCRLTGIESIGYFGWEESFEFGYGSKTEYARLRKERGSYRDQYELEQFEAAIVIGWNSDIVVNVKRTSDGKPFSIPLSELEVVDQVSANYTLLNDYSFWVVNWQ